MIEFATHLLRTIQALLPDNIESHETKTMKIKDDLTNNNDRVDINTKYYQPTQRGTNSRGILENNANSAHNHVKSKRGQSFLNTYSKFQDTPLQMASR